MRGTASVPLGPSITMCGTASVPLGPSITMRGTASVPLGPSITMRGTALVPLRYRSGPLYCNAWYRHPVCVLQSFNWIGVRNFQENTKTNRKPPNIVVPALLQTGRSTLAPRHSKCTSRSTILFGWSVACRLLVWVNVKRLALLSLLDVVWFLVVGLGRGPRLENKFCFPGEYARACGHWAGDWCSPCIGAGFDTLTFQSIVVHFFVALAQKNGPRALASTASRSDWRPLVSKSTSAQWSCKLVLLYK